MSKIAKTIKVKGPIQKLISPAEFAKALGAEETNIRIDMNQDPVSLVALQQYFAAKLRSTGGRPRLVGTIKRRNKIPFFIGDWEKLEVLSRYIREKQGVSVSSGQIASALIHQAVSKLDIPKLKLMPLLPLKKNKDNRDSLTK